jgi:hypothetical protein
MPHDVKVIKLALVLHLDRFLAELLCALKLRFNLCDFSVKVKCSMILFLRIFEEVFIQQIVVRCRTEVVRVVLNYADLLLHAQDALCAQCY